MEELNKPTISTEIVFNTPLNKIEIAPIGFNYDEVKKDIMAVSQYAKSLVFSDEQISQAKEIRAKLNALITNIKSETTAIRKKSLEMCSEAEKQLKELAAIAEEGKTSIDSQIKNFEAAQDQEKREAIANIFNVLVVAKQLDKLITLEKLWNEKWLNKGYKIEVIEKEISDALDNASTAIKLIASLKTPYELHLTDYFIKCLDINATLAEKVRLEQAELSQKQALEQAKQSIGSVVQEEAKQTIEGQETELKAIDFRVWVTEEQKEKLRSFLIENNIRYGAVK
jgi:hypothetical protein